MAGDRGRPALLTKRPPAAPAPAQRRVNSRWGGGGGDADAAAFSSSLSLGLSLGLAERQGSHSTPRQGARWANARMLARNT